MNHKGKKQAGMAEILCLSAFLAFAGLTGCGRQEPEFYTEEELAETTENQAAAAETTETTPTAVSEMVTSESAGIFVDVCGAVVNPGVYELTAGSRVFQAIELAGGYLPEAVGNYLNRASLLSDGQQIYVPTQAEVEENSEKFGSGIAGTASGGAVSGQSAESASGEALVNLNTADEAELTTLTGIGTSKAQAIIAYREANGPFAAIEDLMKVDGIKEGTFAKIKDKITVGT